jgi:hypothetical protein
MPTEGTRKPRPFFASPAAWPAPAAAAATAAWIWACLWFPLTDTDIWWHLAAAKWMSVRHAVPRADPFSLASLGAPWTDLHWGFQLAAYAIWKAGGAFALMAGKCLAVSGALALVLRPHLDRRTWPWLLPLAAAGAYLVRFYLDVRPLALTLLGLGAQYAIILAYLRGRLRRPAFALVPIQAALANVQGLFPLGLALAGSLLAGEFLARRDRRLARACPEAAPAPLRPLALAWVLMLCAGFATPYGWDGFRLPLALFLRIVPEPSNVFSREIAENLPFTDLFRTDPALGAACLAWAGVAAWSFLRVRPAAGHLLLFLAFGTLGLMAQRNLPLALLAGLAAAGRNLQVSLEEEAPPIRPGPPPAAHFRAGLAGWAALLAVAAAFGPRLLSAWAFELPGSPITPFRVPEAAVAYLERHPLEGPIFNELRFGGYLEFRLYPEPAFLDGRMILRSGEFYREFLAAADRPERFPAYRARYGFTHALLPIAEDARFLPLASWLLRSGWELLYCDGAAVLLADPGLGAGGMDLDSLPAGHPLPEAVRARFGANPRLERLAAAYARAFLGLAGRERAAADLGALFGPVGNPAHPP